MTSARVLSALSGAIALFFLVKRLAGGRAAALAVLVLVTTPLYLGRVDGALDELAPMAASAIAMSGLGLAVFDSSGAWVRVPAFALGLGGLALGGVTGGVFLGAALPALGVALAWLLLALAGQGFDRSRERMGALCLGGSLLLLALGVRNEPSWTGDGRFDRVLRDLAHAAFPWSALLPWAAGRLFGPIIAAPGVFTEGVFALRVLLMTSAATTLVGMMALVPASAPQAFQAPAALAGIAALALQDLDFGAPRSRALGLVTGATGCVLLVDFLNFPGTSWGALGPPEIKHFSAALGRGGLVLATVASLLAFYVFVADSARGRRTLFPGSGGVAAALALAASGLFVEFAYRWMLD